MTFDSRPVTGCVTVLTVSTTLFTALTGVFAFTTFELAAWLLVPPPASSSWASAT